MSILKTKQKHIMLIEDNPGDVTLVKDLLDDHQADYRMSVAEDGAHAIDTLNLARVDLKYDLPDLILLDLNLPNKSGIEVLEAIKTDSILKRIPVIVLTSSKDKRDIMATYHLHANCYLNKPTNIEDFSRMIRLINEFWLGEVVYPSQGV
ncbi:MAG: response regulator [Spirochaetia bacterium]|nr:response regulator [Spirochaetia bacterium]